MNKPLTTTQRSKIDLLKEAQLSAKKSTYTGREFPNTADSRHWPMITLVGGMVT